MTKTSDYAMKIALDADTRKAELYGVKTKVKLSESNRYFDIIQFVNNRSRG
jgi:hypothetical protein